jgi:hypothetical protein
MKLFEATIRTPTGVNSKIEWEQTTLNKLAYCYNNATVPELCPIYPV